jgi:hypothetical protein
MRDENRPHTDIVTSRYIPHCARGPKGCEKCAETAKEKVHCLVRVFDDHGMIARPVLEIERAGEKSYLEYDMLQRFSNLSEAKQYAEENRLEYIETS